MVDLIALVVASAMSMHAFVQREEYEVSNLFLVEKGLTSSTCNSEDYKF